MNEFIATFKTSQQISPDDFAVYNPTLKITESTTIGEIQEWFHKKHGGPTMEVTIIQLETK